VTELILKLKQDDHVCAVCDFIEFAVLITLPFAVPVFIMYATKMN
jgi:hypothetical protein